MSARTLLILGAGESQVPAYREARRLGYRVVGVDRRPDPPAAPLCDELLRVTTTDPAAIVGQLNGAPVAGVVAPATNPAVPTQRALSRHYATPYRVPAAAVRASVSKARFRRAVDGLGLPAYGWAHGSSVRALTAAARKLRFPVIVKPNDGAGSRGLGCAAEPSAVAAAARRALASSPTGEAVVEELVRGGHYSAEAFLGGGRALVLGISERRTTGPPAFLTVAHQMPAELPEATVERVREQVEAVCAAIDLDRGPANFDLVVDGRGEPHLIEMGARLGGNGLDRLVWHTQGVNLVEATLKLAVGEPHRVAPFPRGAGIVYALHSRRRGVLAAIDGVEESRRVPGVVGVELHARAGATVLPYQEGACKLGYLMVAAPTPARARAALGEALGRLRLEVVGGGATR